MTSSNSRIEGAAIGLSTIVSPSPMTTNWTPGSSPNLVRMASGMTTCPLEDILVVRTSVMARILPVRQALGASGSRREARRGLATSLVRCLAAAFALFGALACQPEETTVGVVLDTDLGEIEVRVYPERAPISANNFLVWVEGGHYEGATFYRVTRPDNTSGPSPHQVVQGGLLGEIMRRGEPTDEAVGPIPPIAHETTDTTGIRNERGTIAYARLEPGTADSEFFFNIADNPALDTGNTTRQPDGQGYATFGRVVRGMEILEDVQGLATLTDAGSEVTRGQMLEGPVVIRRAWVLD